MSVEAGTTFGWDRWVGDDGYSVGVDHFGASAPAGDVYEGFDLTAEEVAGHARNCSRGGLGMRFACGFDHGGYPLRETVFDALKTDGHVPVDLGASELDPGDDYPDFALAVVRAMVAGDAERGILVCGSGRRRRGRRDEGRGHPRGDGARHVHGRAVRRARQLQRARARRPRDRPRDRRASSSPRSPTRSSAARSATSAASAKVDAIERDGVDAQL